MTKADTVLRVVVVGAGPAGLAAAKVAARPGIAVTMLDDNPAPGGQVWRSGPGHPPPSRSVAAQQALIRSGVTTYSGCRVVGIRAPGVLMLDAPNANNVPRALAWDRLILATGARERFLPFPGWTLPGVTGAGAAQALIKGGVPAHGKRVMVAGSGPLLLASAATLRAAGASVLMVVEQAPARAMLHFAKRLIQWPGKLAKAAMLRAQLAGVPYHWNSHVVAAEGEGKLHSLRVSLDGVQKTIACDWLACGFGLQANLELAYALGCEVDTIHGLPAVKIDQQQQTSVAGVFAVGEATGIGGLDKAWAEGHAAGLAATGQVVKSGLARHTAFGDLLSATFVLRPELMQLGQENTTVCRCEDVSLGTLRAHPDWRTAKLATRCGMGACQGRICTPICHDVLGWPLPSPSLQQGIRQPIHPVSLARLLRGLRDMPG
ncbi:MAG: FAD-dependent oxidoreductase [Rhodoferax sp.]|nr:FAD-dependent oxidoreductase [Rhodoferax sp.]